MQQQCKLKITDCHISKIGSNNCLRGKAKLQEVKFQLALITPQINLIGYKEVRDLKSLIIKSSIYVLIYRYVYYI